MSADRAIDALAKLAREAEPPPLSRDRASAMIARAARTAPVAPPRRAPIRAIALAASLLLAAAGAWSVVPQAPSASSVTLPSGDRLVGSAGARFEIVAVTAARQVRIEDGTVAFDVAPLGAGSSFEVVTPDLVARVVGTVFTVEAGRDRSIVRVYEGRVRVEIEGEAHVLSAGESFSTDGALDRDPMAELARAMAGRRAGAPHIESPPRSVEAPSPTPAPARAPEPQPIARARELRVAPRITPPTAPSPPITPSVSRPAPPPIALPPPPPADPDEVRRWIASGDRSRALEAARAAIARGEPEAGWRMLEGDALRGLRRPNEAAIAYERAIHDPAHAAQAGYLLARLRAREIHDPLGALEALDQCACDSSSSPLAERALGLRIDLLHDLARAADADAAERAYLERFPDGPRAAALRAR